MCARDVDARTPGSIEVAASDSLLVDNSLLSVNTSGSGNAGAIDIASPTVTFRHGPLDFGQQVRRSGRLAPRAETTSTGAGWVDPHRADAAAITDSAWISADAVASRAHALRGDAGQVEIAADSVILSDRSMIGAAGLGQHGRSGTITIDLGETGASSMDGATTREGPVVWPTWIIAGNGGTPGRIDILGGGSVDVSNGGANDDHVGNR